MRDTQVHDYWQALETAPATRVYWSCPTHATSTCSAR